MFDLMMKLAKKKFGKSDPEDPVREYMRLEVELEEVCSLQVMEMSELKRMTSNSLYSFFGGEKGLEIEQKLVRMQELWKSLSNDDKEYLSPPTSIKNLNREIVEYDELAQDFIEKEYLEIDKGLEDEAEAHFLHYNELISMDVSKMVTLLGKELANDVRIRYERAIELWGKMTIEQRDRNSLKGLNRKY